MKYLTLAASLLLASTATVFAEVKIGTVDMVILVRNHQDYKKNKELLTSTESDHKNKLEAKKTNLQSIQDEGRKLADELRNPMLADASKKTLENRLVEIQNRFIKAQQDLRSEAMRLEQDLSEMEARLLRFQAKDIKAKIEQFAEENGYDMVLDSSAALYAQKSHDVTDGVLKVMGVDPVKAREVMEKEKNESK